MLGAPKVLPELHRVRGIQRDFGKGGHSMVRRHTSLRSISLHDCVSNWRRDVSGSSFRKSCSELRQAPSQILQARLCCVLSTDRMSSLTVSVGGRVE